MSLPCHRKLHAWVNNGTVKWVLWISVLWLLVSAGIAEHPTRVVGSTMTNLWGTSANLRDFSVFGLCLHLDRVGPLCRGSPGEGWGKVPITAGHLTQTSDSPWALCLSSPSSVPQPGVRGTPRSTAMAQAVKGWGRGTASRLHFVIQLCPCEVRAKSCWQSSEQHLLWNSRNRVEPGVPRMLVGQVPGFCFRSLVLEKQFE